MAFFRPTIPAKQKEELQHPWAKTIKNKYSHAYKYGHNSVGNRPYPIQKELNRTTERIKLTVIGNRITKEFIYCYYLVKGLYKYRKKQFELPVIQGFTDVEWPTILHNLKIQYGSKAYCLQSQVAVIVNDTFLGGEQELQKFLETKYVYHLCLDYYHESIKQLANYIKSSGRPCAYMHFSINGKEIGNMIFMLYADVVPRTCENFLRLCQTTKGGYSGTPVHRIVKDCWIQCGGFSLKNSPELDCENFSVLHDRRGVLCMTNDGRHVECSTQFFVLLQPASWMENKYVAFGQLIKGEKTLKKIENVPTWYESPTNEIIIYKAGVFNMECQYMPINKNTNAYIHAHIENLYELGELFYEELLKRAFDQIESNRLKNLEELVEEASIKKRHERKSSSTSSNDETYVNNDFDVDAYEYEVAHYAYSQDTKPSSVVKPELPYYIPLSDVPYPGETESTCNLKKFLNGNYCLESDLEQNIAKRKIKPETSRRLSIPEHIVGNLFECLAFGDDDDNSKDSMLNEYENALIQTYATENADSVSFAGPLIKEMANIPRKFEMFEEGKREAALNRLLTDDELRMIRMALKEYKTSAQRRVSIHLNTAKISHSKILRNPSKYFNEADFAKFGIDNVTLEAMKQDDEIASLSTKDMPQLQTPRRSSVRSQSVRRSTLFTQLSRENVDERPTLKSYKSSSAFQSKKSYVLLTYSQPLLKDDDKSQFNFTWQPTFVDSIEHILKLQHGSRIYRKLSSDYVRTIDHLEQVETQSIRTFEFSKRRPSISVPQYKLENKRYQESINELTKVNETSDSGRRGLRLPGDSPVYSLSRFDLNQ